MPAEPHVQSAFFLLEGMMKGSCSYEKRENEAEPEDLGKGNSLSVCHDDADRRNDRLRQFAEIRRLHHQPRNALIHQRLKRMRHQLCIAARIRQRCHNQIAAVKVRQLHAGWIIFKQNSLRHRAFQPILTSNQTQMMNILKPKQLLNVNQVRSPPALLSQMTAYILSFFIFFCKIQ